MKKLLKRKDQENQEDQEEVVTGEPDVLTLLQEIQQQLISLEEKIDGLASQSQERPRERSFRRDRGDREGGFRDRERSFTRAVCAQCNKECEVPFKPTGDRPVYCKDCFSKRNEGGSFEGRRDSRPRSGGFDRERHGGGRGFDKRPGGESRGFGKRKPAFRKRKERF